VSGRREFTVGELKMSAGELGGNHVVLGVVFFVSPNIKRWSQ